MGSPPPSPSNLDDYSAAATLILFPAHSPFYAGPSKPAHQTTRLPARTSSHSKTLAPGPPHTKTAKHKSPRNANPGRESGAPFLLPANAKPPGGKSFWDFSEREKCEEREMEACFVAAKERCGDFAKQKCGPAFRDARIEVSGLDLKVVDWKDVSRLISGVCLANEKSYGVGFWGVEKSWGEFKRKYEVTNVRGSDLLSSGKANIEEYLRRNS
ncbi:hypothetical protein DH2020_001485 [Rehmannia glutinosa]|uniref:Uncharacterized protein n=1 Tax=Rehmannia glutinosa TaxID=99300 RepID=A0ABR0XZT9_REHGL